MVDGAADTKANASQGWDDDGETGNANSAANSTQTQQNANSTDGANQAAQGNAEDQVLNTKLGRKVKEQGEAMEALKTQNQQLLEAVQRLESHLSTETTTATDKKGDVSERLGDDLYDQMCAIEPPPVEFVTTPKEQVKMAQWEKRVSAKMEQKMRGAYEGSYINATDSLKEDGGDLHAEVVRLITTNTPYNVSRGTGRGDLDAQLNYHAALSALLSGKVKPSGTFGNNGQQTVRAGVTVGTTSTATGKKTVQLSAEAAEYARYLGYTDDQISESMDRPIVSK